MKKLRLTALVLVLALLLPMAAQALTVEQAKQLLDQYYIDELPDAAWKADTIEGVLDAVGDPYTAYMTAQEYEEFLSYMQDSESVGIGVVCEFVPGLGIYITRVFPTGAAADVLEPGDILLSIDGTALAELNLESALLLLRGEEGSEVRLSVQRGAATLAPITLVRTTYVIPTTVHELIDGHIGYIGCGTFGPETKAHFEEAIKDMDDAADGWIVDLRGNGGGEMQAAADALGVFTGTGDASYLRDRAGDYYRYGTWPEVTTIDPVIVLVDEATASAAELFAGGIQSYTAGIVIGSRTYGKGVSQLMLDEEVEPDYFPDGDALKITGYRTFFVNGCTADVIGVVPNLIVAPEYAGDVALLLSAASPDDNGQALRVHLGRWRLYIDLAMATSEAYYPAFVALLEALPFADELLYLGTGDGTWDEVSVWEVAALCAPDFVGHNFPDLGGSPYADAINTLGVLGFVRGNEYGAFMPKSELTRAELCALLAQAVRYAGQSGTVFSDVSEDAWYASAVAAVYKCGLVQGYDGRFAPDDVVTHEQYFVILGRLAARLNLYAYDALAQGMPPEAAESGDYDAFSDWAQELIWLGEGLFFDDAATVNPHAPTTREEAATGLYRMLRSLGYL